MRRPLLSSLHRSRLAGVLAASLALLLALPAAAQWRWRDANGRVTVSDRPPPREIPDKDILQRPGTAARAAAAAAPASVAASGVAVAASGAASVPVDKELQARKKAAETEQQAKAKAEEQRNAAIRADNCARARSHLATLDSGQRLARINDKGEREVLDDEARAAEVRRAREVIASDCR
ncbi:MAG: DUF4124 domain-containing protein [Rubrivivax sp.]